MKKIILIILAIGMAIFAALPVIAATTINAVDSSDVIQATFTVNDDVYLSGQCVSADDPLTPVDVYVVPHQPIWNPLDALVDVRGAPTPANSDALGNIANTLIWAAPLVDGEYDLVLDVNPNLMYDPGIDCIDEDVAVGFTVVPAPVVGSGTATVGTNDPGDHGWVLGPGDPNNVMLQLELAVDGTEDVTVNSFTLNASGTGNDLDAIFDVKIYEDELLDGEYLQDPTLWGSATYDADDGTATVNVSETILRGTSRTIIVVYEMGTSDLFSDGDTFEFSLDVVDATGFVSQQSVSFANVPVSSGVKTIIVPGPGCSGAVNLTFPQSSYAPDETITAEIDGLVNCDTKTVEVRDTSCDGDLICSCVLDLDACSCDFATTQAEGIYTISACLDLNSDTDFLDLGEEDSALLTIETPVVALPPFDDIVDHWAESFITDLYNLGVVEGRSIGVFAPNELITRAEVTKIAMLAFGHSVPTSLTEDPFPDVPFDAWFAPYVSTGIDIGAVEGYPDGDFRPGQNINRVEVLKILEEAAGVDPLFAPEATFPDTESGVWYSPYINYGIENGVVSGYTTGELAGMFAPGNNATRAEVAKMTSILISSISS